MENRNNLIAIFFIIFLAMGAGFFYLKFLPIFPVEGDSSTYNIIAKNLANGRGFSIEEGVPTASRPPGYPLFLAIIFKIFGQNLNAVRIVQIFILAGIGLLIYLMGRKYLRLHPGIAALASCSIIIWPYFILYTTLITAEVLFIFFLCLFVYLLLKFGAEKTYKNALAAGVSLGIAALIKSTALLLPIWLAGALFIFWKLKSGETQWKKIAVFLLAASAVISAWSARNFINVGKFVPADNSITESVQRAYISYDYVSGRTALKRGEADLKMAVISRLKNIYLFWNPGINSERTRALVKNHPWLNNLFLAYKIMFFMIIASAFSSLRFIKRKEIFLLWAIILYFWAFHTILYPYPRYTLPIIPLMILLALFSQVKFWTSLKARSEISSVKT